MSIWDSDDVISRDLLMVKVRGASGIFCTLNDKIDEGVLEAAGTIYVLPLVICPTTAVSKRGLVQYEPSLLLDIFVLSLAH